MLEKYIPPETTKKTHEALKGLGETVTDGFAKGVQGIFTLFKELYKSSREKGFMGSFLKLFTDVFSGKNEKIKQKAVEAAKDVTNVSARNELRKEIGTCSVKPEIPPHISDGISESLKGSREAIVKAVELSVQGKVTADHCWNWTEKVYAMAGFHPSRRRFVYNSVPRYAKYNYSETKEGKGEYRLDKKGGYIKDSKNGTHNRKRVKFADCGKHHVLGEMGEEPGIAYLRENLKPGDHFFINNKNRYDFSGNHSEIFLGWIDKKNLVARVAGYPGKKNPPYISKRRFAPNERGSDWSKVTAIVKPILVKKPLVA